MGLYIIKKKKYPFLIIKYPYNIIMEKLPLEIENIIMDYKSQLEVAEKYQKCINEIKESYYSCFNDFYSTYKYKNVKRQILLLEKLYIWKNDIRIDLNGDLYGDL